MKVVASLSQGRTAAAQCGLFTYKSVPVIFEPPCTDIRALPLNFFDTCLCLLKLAKTLRLLDVHRLVTVCAKTSISLGNISFHSNKFYSNL